MARVWTKDQQAAIDERDRTLLVSAAAGSGKTATLTERIIRSLTDEAHPADISRMLIVTFTRASAADLRQKISAALNEAMAGGRMRAHLSRQLLLLPAAQISTIDSFCVSLVREHAVMLGLSPTFRIADGAENRLLMGSVMNRLIEDAYEGSTTEFEGGEPFCRLADCLTGTRGDRGLDELLLSLYNKTAGYVRAYHSLSDMAEQMRAACHMPPLATPWGAFFAGRIREQLDSYITGHEEIIPALAVDTYACVAYLPAFEADLAAMRALRGALQEGEYTRVRAAIVDFPRANMKPLTGEKKSEAAAAAHAMRNRFFAQLKHWRERYVAYTEEEWVSVLGRLAEQVSLLGHVLSAFGSRMAEEKRRRNICDFNDVVHAALRLLYDEDGNKTPLCREIASRFDYVYIDEYQDVNEVQHRLFEALAQPRGRFMVGDIKQSIYGFRGAQPRIFKEIRKSFLPLDAAGDSESASLSLSQNFRSEPPILSFVNLVFGGLMQGVGEHIGYCAESDRLIPRPEAATDAPRVTVALFEKQADGAAENRYGDAEDEDPVEEEESDTPDEEALYVAAEIERLVRAGRPAGDIAILTRSGGSGKRFAAALEARGIPADRAADGHFFYNPEILLAISLLNVIDNPRRDIYLAGLLRSPIYGFTMDELILLRQEAEAGPQAGCTLYEALLAYTAQHLDFTKGERFLSDLAAFREMAEGMSVDRLIWQLYRHTGLLSIAGADKNGSPEARRANLMLLYDYARRFEASSFHGLYNFIDYINQAIERDQSIDEGGGQSGRADSVRIMTIHRSKGLEFPVCFVCGAGARCNLRDAYATLLFDGEYGCAFKLRTENGAARVRNPVYNAISEVIQESQLEEEMRVLYVALTRPQTRLYVTATIKDVPAALATAEERNRRLGAAEVGACRSYAEMILATAIHDTSYDLLLPGQQTAEDGCLAAEPMATQPSTEEIERLRGLLQARFAYVYPDEHLRDLPSKLSVSRLYPSLLDGEEEPLWSEEEQTSAEQPAYTPAPPPLFMGGQREDAAARAGTATHLFMQFCDFGRLATDGAEAELTRLRERGFLTAEDAALVRLREIEAFCRSPLFAALTAGGELYREQRFHVRMPAAAFTTDPVRQAAYRDRTVLVQGVMDAVLRRPDGQLWLIDYKTDRLTREERADRTLAAAKLAARHGLQLSYYAQACRDLFGRLPDKILLYSLHLGDAIELPCTLPAQP